MMVPWKAPIRAHAAMPTMSPAHQTQFCGAPIRAMAMDAPTAPTNPTERSISLRIRAYSSAIPSRMMKVDWTKRLTMLVDVRKALDFTSKKMLMTMSPTMMGSAPLSPPRMRFHHARR